MSKIYLSIGGNLGNKLENIRLTQISLNEIVDRLLNFSPIYETEAWGFEHNNNFYNQVIIAETMLAPTKLLDKIQIAEKKLGRERKTESSGYKGRFADIDILFYDNKIINNKRLKIPHPLLHERLFVLKPLHDIEPGLVHPENNNTVDKLLKSCTDKTKVNKLDISPNLITDESY